MVKKGPAVGYDPRRSLLSGSAYRIFGPNTEHNPFWQVVAVFPLNNGVFIPYLRPSALNTIPVGCNFPMAATGSFNSTSMPRAVPPDLRKDCPCRPRF